MNRTLPQEKYGYTIIELILAVTIIGILSSTALFSYANMRDRISVNSATQEIVTMLANARHIAMTQSRYTTVIFALNPAEITVQTEIQHLTKRALKELYGVKISTPRSSVTYAPNGLTTGIANFTLTVSKGKAADTISMSRLGRVR